MKNIFDFLFPLLTLFFRLHRMDTKLKIVVAMKGNSSFESVSESRHVVRVGTEKEANSPSSPRDVLCWTGLPRSPRYGNK
jgi:hypothetical protein